MQKSGPQERNQKSPGLSGFSGTDEQQTEARLLDSHGLGQVTGEVDVETFHHSQPVGNQLQRDDVQETLQNIHSLGDLDRLGLAGAELAVAGVADDNGLATS